MTPEERQGIIDEAVNKAAEKALRLIENFLLTLPETIGSLITDHIAINKTNAEFYKKHPEFKDKKDIVASVIEKVDGENPLLDYKDVLGKAVPEIRRRIDTVGSLNMETVSPNPSRVYEPLSIPKVDNQHGEL